MDDDEEPKKPSLFARAAKAVSSKLSAMKSSISRRMKWREKTYPGWARKGTKVSINGVKKVELNGQTGTVDKPNDDTADVIVNGVKYSIPFTNLTPVSGGKRTRFRRRRRTRK